MSTPQACFLFHRARGEPVATTTSHVPTQTHSVRDDTFIAADVGGTHVRIGLIRPGSDISPLQVSSYRNYACNEYTGLDEILGDFLAQPETRHVRRGVVATAGYPMDDGRIISANLPWSLSPDTIRRTIDFDDLRIVNDFAAVAYAAAHMDSSQVLRLSGPETTPGHDGPVLILGPGTGLGAALWIPTPARPIILATEAGQASLAAGNAMEIEVLSQLLAQHDHVSIEHTLSGPGLMNLYTTLCYLAEVDPRYTTPSQITEAAVQGHDQRAHQSLEIFCGLLGSTVGDMALLYGAKGGIYLAGGILPQISQFLLHSSFVSRFLNKGPMRAALERIPVRLVEHGQLGVIGAAHWYLDQQHGQ
ncbi:glucokinase [Pseudoxanthomonas sp.]|uniref:glucokinase n=1 Tax=Pseudoxanthomonas sp. TaxID=1871049 RepID=UPI00260F98D2|nr:glucokinase [Pseudoxanthomonas sp.]WDS35439.1 MAG: glucokinase [Pseudoxanthomonas sp.]